MQHSSVSDAGPTLIAVTLEAQHGNRVVVFLFVCFLAKFSIHLERSVCVMLFAVISEVTVVCLLLHLGNNGRAKGLCM